MYPVGNRRLWLRWVLANAVGEVLGLGSTFAIGLVISSRMVEVEGAGLSVGTGLTMVATGAVEGGVVGLAQWWAMHRRFDRIRAGVWIGATVAGALIAWMLGVIPFVTANAGAMGEAAPSAEPDPLMGYLLLGVIGAAAGAVLALIQWLVLRRHVRRAWRWLPANAVAWMAGLPLVFATIGAVPSNVTPLAAGVTLVAGLAAAGAIVGTIHGAQLVRFEVAEA